MDAGPEVRPRPSSLYVVLVVEVDPQALPARREVPAARPGAGEAPVNSETLDGRAMDVAA